MTLDLVSRAQRGDHGAFDILVGQRAPALYRLAVVVIGQEAAADVTQDALLRAWRELPNLRDPARFDAWIRRILVNRCRDMSRARRRGRPIISLDDISGSPGLPAFPDHAPGIERTSDLRSAVSRLSVDHRAILALHYALDLPINEVASTLGVPEGTAKSRLHAALVALRTILSEGGR